MKPVMQAAIIFLICLLGEAIVSLFSLSFPSSVIAMILLFLLLLQKMKVQLQLKS